MIVYLQYPGQILFLRFHSPIHSFITQTLAKPFWCLESTVLGTPYPRHVNSHPIPPPKLLPYRRGCRLLNISKLWGVVTVNVFFASPCLARLETMFWSNGPLYCYGYIQHVESQCFLPRVVQFPGTLCEHQVTWNRGEAISSALRRVCFLLSMLQLIHCHLSLFCWLKAFPWVGSSSAFGCSL